MAVMSYCPLVSQSAQAQFPRALPWKESSEMKAQNILRCPDDKSDAAKAHSSFVMQRYAIKHMF